MARVTENQPRPDLAFFINRFHRTIEGIRELRDIAAPHLSSPEPRPRLLRDVVQDMTPEQRAVTVLALLRQGEESPAQPASSPAGEGTADDSKHGADADTKDKSPHSAEEMDDDLAVITVSGMGQQVRLAITDEIKEPLDKAIRGNLSEKAFVHIVQTAFPDNISLLTEFLRSMASPQTVSPDKEELLNSAMLITAVVAFETLMIALLSAQFTLFPGLLQAGDRQFSLDDLKEFESIADARDAAIEQRVDALMREGFSRWQRWFAKEAKLHVEELCLDEVSLREVFQRRNVVVHSASQVSRQYLSNVPESTAALGDVLVVDSDYLRRALDELDVLGVSLASSAWASWQPTEADAAVDSVHLIAFHLLQSDRWEACEKLCSVGRGLGGHAWVREAMQVNAWIARKRTAGLDNIESEVHAWDTSASAIEFALAKAALLVRNDEALALIRPVVESGKFDAETLENWPLLADLREDPRFEKLMADLKAEEAQNAEPSSDEETDGPNE